MSMEEAWIHNGFVNVMYEIFSMSVYWNFISWQLISIHIMFDIRQFICSKDRSS